MLRTYEIIKEVYSGTNEYQDKLLDFVLLPKLLGRQTIHRLFSDAVFLSAYYSDSAVFDRLRLYCQERDARLRKLFEEAGVDLDIPTPLQSPGQPEARIKLPVDNKITRLPEVKTKVVSRGNGGAAPGSFVVYTEGIGLDIAKGKKKGMHIDPAFFGFAPGDWM